MIIEVFSPFTVGAISNIGLPAVLPLHTEVAFLNLQVLIRSSRDRCRIISMHNYASTTFAFFAVRIWRAAFPSYSFLHWEIVCVWIARLRAGARQTSQGHRDFEASWWATCTTFWWCKAVVLDGVDAAWAFRESATTLVRLCWALYIVISSSKAVPAIESVETESNK